MAVYRKNRAGKEEEAYIYDFQLNGSRYSGPTGKKTEREAKRVEREKKVEAARENEKLKKLKGALWTFDQAVTNYLNEHLGGDADDTTLASLGWLQQRLGQRRLIDIDDSVIAGLVAERAADIVPNKKTPTRVSNSTVNRTVTEPLRRVLRRALAVHKQPAGDITWSVHLKKEPPERVRELKDFEEEKLFAAIPEDYHPIIRFHLLSGVRLAESVNLTWDDIDFGNRLIMISGKGGTRESIPMPPSLRDVLFPLQGHDPHFVFTYIVKKNQFNPNTRKPYVRGQRLPIAYSGLKTCFRRARKKAGITDFRFHDQRHTAATRTLRVSNLKVVQKMLRHRDIATTTRYAHVDNDDIMAAMEKAAQMAVTSSPTNSPTQPKIEGKNEAITKG